MIYHPSIAKNTPLNSSYKLHSSSKKYIYTKHIQINAGKTDYFTFETQGYYLVYGLFSTFEKLPFIDTINVIFNNGKSS